MDGLSRKERAQRRGEAPALVETLRHQGVGARILDAATGHMRLSRGPKSVDFWIATRRWRELRTGLAGQGADTMAPVLGLATLSLTFETSEAA